MSFGGVPFRILAAVIFFFIGVCASSAEDRLGVAVPYLPEELSIACQTDPVTRIVFSTLAKGLTRLGEGGTAELDLADSVQSDADNRVWKFEIRPDISFSNGDLFTPESVRDSFGWLKALARAVEGPSFGRQSLFGIALENITNVSVEESAKQGNDILPRRRVRFDLIKSDPSFLGKLYSFPIADPYATMGFGVEYGKGTQLIFVGPYQVREYRAGQLLVLEKTGGYFRPGVPRSGVVEFKVFPDASSALTALRGGGVSIIAFATEHMLASVRLDSTLQVYESPLQNMDLVGDKMILPRSHWSKSDDSQDAILMTKIIARRTVVLDVRARSFFDLSGSYLP